MSSLKFPPIGSGLPPLSVRTMSNISFGLEGMSISAPSSSLNETIPMEIDQDVSYIAPRTLNSYEIIRTLGQGSQGRVELAKIKSTGQIIALKVVYIKDAETLNVANKEIAALEQASSPSCSPFVSCYYNHFYDPDIKSMLIEMEYIDGVDLDVWAKKYRDAGNYVSLYHNLVLLIIDLCRALSYLHAKGLIHRDIKPANILITANNEPKLVDLGLSCNTKICPTAVPNLAYTCCYGRAGTPIFLAPEVISKAESYFASDVWSLGGTIFRAASGTYAFPVLNPNDVQTVMQTILNRSPYLLETSNVKLNQVVNSMLSKVPELRPTIPEILSFLL